MKDKNSKIIDIQKYLFKKKKQALSSKKIEKNQDSMADEVVLNIIDLSSYLKTKGLNEKTQKDFLNDNQKKIGKIIPFSQKKRNQQKWNQKFKDLKKGESSVLFLEDYLERKNFPKDLFETQVERESSSGSDKIYKPVAWIAASLLAVFSSSILYQQLQQGTAGNLAEVKRQTPVTRFDKLQQGTAGNLAEVTLGSELQQKRDLASEKLDIPEEVKNLDYKTERTPQNKEIGLSPTEYVKYLRRKPDSILKKGQKGLSSL